jgi:hypothetical protein
VPLIAVLMGLFLPALLGGLVLYFTDAPLLGLPKDGSGRSFAQHVAFVAAALTAAPIIGWAVIPIAVPVLRLLIQTGWAGIGSAILVALLIGLPLVHWMLNGDVTTEDSSILAHIVAALMLQGTVGWGVMQVLLPRAAISAKIPPQK